MYEDRMALFGKIPGAFDLYMQLEEVICARYPRAEIRPKRSQVGFFDGYGFAWASPPLRGKAGITVTLGLPERLSSDRVFAAAEPYPGRWTHHFLVHSSAQFDDEFISWLDAAHAFAAVRSRK